MNKIVDDDPIKLTNDVIVALQQRMDERLEPGDERRMVVEVVCGAIAGAQYSINAAALKKYYEYQDDDELDKSGQDKNCPRLEAISSTTAVTLTLPSIKGVDSVVPKGTRVTADGKVYFTITEDVIIPKGAASITALFYCTIPGLIGDGYAVGSIKTLTDGLSFAVNVSNTTVSSGGAERESKDAYIKRLRLADSRNAAGSEEAYEFHARSSNVLIDDVKVIGESTSSVKIVLLMKSGRIPTAEELNTTKLYVSDKRRKALNDHINVVGPTAVNYSVAATYFIPKERYAEESTLKSAIESAALEYSAWQTTAIDRDINPDQLRYFLVKAGALKADIQNPVAALVGNTQVARETSMNLIYGGLA